mmetsp:Transcript_3430/g.5243  ORF Transcript_3430/g.5243 Transcript_3430/m.5243 type:complete len:333 (+) Transcript_3430:64-1062(+)
MQRLHPSLHHPAARAWCEPTLHATNLVYPVFVTLAANDCEIDGFAPNKQWGKGESSQVGEMFEGLVKHLKELEAKGLRSVMLFGVVKGKDADGSKADSNDTPVVLAIREIRKSIPDMMVMCDVCMCEYTDHGHCGLLRCVDDEQVIHNDSTIDRLANIALCYAKNGAHWVCPSDMMDGRVSSIRNCLDKNGFEHVGIMAYTSKKASVMYAPFRAAVESTFEGDRKRYQQPVGSILHARQALQRDQAEGASVVLVKPCLFYGDIVKEYSQQSNLPIACYVVSGEYVMLKDYAKRTGDLENVLRESHVGLLRAGASILITYFSPELLDLIPKWG